MSLADRLKAGAVYVPSCPFCRLLNDLPEGDREALVEAAADPLQTTSGITMAIRAEGFRISEKTVSFHRKGACLK